MTQRIVRPDPTDRSPRPNGLFAPTQRIVQLYSYSCTAGLAIAVQLYSCTAAAARLQPHGCSRTTAAVQLQPHGCSRTAAYSCSCPAAVVQLQLYNNSTSWGGNHPILWNPVGFCGILQDPMESCGIDGCETYPQTSPSRSGRRPTPEFPQTTVYSVLYCTVTVQCSILCSAVQYSTLYNSCTVQCTVLYCTVTLQ